jgi:hypothetical protein
MYLREDGTPYYVGKGKGRRAYTKRKRVKPPSSRDMIVFPYTNLTEEESFQREIELIAKYGRKDNGTGILRNFTDGGEGASGYIPTPEVLKKLRGRKHTPEHIEKTRLANLGKKRSKEFGERSSIRQKGKVFSPEHKEKISKAHLGKKRSLEHRENIGRVQRGKKLSPETIERMRQAQLKRWKIRLQTKALQAQNAGLDNFLSDYLTATELARNASHKDMP